MSTSNQPLSEQFVSNFTANITLNRHSSRPLYLQLELALTAMLQSNAISNKEGLPAERTLASALGVSRAVVQRAYDALRQKGILDSFGRQGTLVRTGIQIQPEMGRAKSLAEEMQEQGLNAQSELVSLEFTTNRLMASIFRIPSHSKLLNAVRTHLGDGMVMARESLWVDLETCPKMADWDGLGSSYAAFQALQGYPVDSADQTIEAIISSDVEMTAFDLKAAIPCLLIKRRTFTRPKLLLEYSEVTFRGDAYTYHLNLKN